MIDEAQIQYLERLARIRLNPEQRAEFREEIGRILTYMERLAAIDDTPVSAGSATGPADAGCVEETAATAAAIAGAAGGPAGSDRSVVFGIASCRADELRPSLAREDLLAMSPEATGEYMTVPRAVQ